MGSGTLDCNAVLANPLAVPDIADIDDVIAPRAFANRGSTVKARSEGHQLV